MLLSVISWNVSTSGSWSTAADWSGGKVPKSTDDVTLNKAGVVVTLTAGTSVDSITVTNGTLNISGGTTTVAANSSIGSSAVLNLSDATLTLSSSATLTNSGSITVSPGSKLNVAGAYSEAANATLTLPSGTARTGVTTNLLADPGFESPSAGSSTTTGPAGWSTWGSSYVSTQYDHTGSQSLSMQTALNSSSGATQTYAVTPSASYSASVFALTPTTTPLTGSQGAFIQISFYDSSGNSISNSSFVTVLSSTSTAGAWTNATVTATAPSNASSATLYMQEGPYTGNTGTAGGTVYWDDAQFGPTSTTVITTKAAVTAASVTNSGTITVGTGDTLSDAGAFTQTTTGTLTLPSGTASAGVGTNLVEGAGFESPSAGTGTTTEPGNWGQWGLSYVSTQYAHNGSQSLSMQTANSNSNSGVYQSFGVSPGVSYSASVLALTPTSAPLVGGQGAFFSISFSDASGNSISGSGEYITALNANSSTGLWTSPTIAAVTAPSNAVTATIDLQVGPYSGISGTAGGGVFWDDVQFGPTAINSSAITAGSISNSGTIMVGAGDTVTTSGTFTQSATGTLGAQLGEPASGGFFGSMTAAGSATLAGTLRVSLVNSYAPSLNDSFTLLNDANESGTFAAYQLPSGSTYAFQAGVNPTYVGISAVSPTLSVTVNAATTTTTATSNLVGVNLAYWDSLLTTTQTQSMVESAGLSLFRFPGGSGSDDYHFNNQYNYGYSATTIGQFATFISNVGGTGIVTTNYGTASPQEAEAELAYLEGSTSDTTSIGTGIEWQDATSTTDGYWYNVNWQTVGYWASLRAASPLGTDDGLNFMRLGHAAPFTNIKYWEIGNEEYGSWEDDQHGVAGPGGISTGAQHDPATYAKFVAAFENFDATDTSLPVVLAGIDSGDPTGSGDNNWTRNVVTDLYADGGYAPGFISDHSYAQAPGTENDSFLLNDTVSDSASILDWSTRYSDYESMLQQVLGSKASTVKVMATEYNSNYGTEGKQMTSIVNGLYVADSIGSLLNSGYTGGLVWDLRNGWTTNGNNSSTLYGWREGGDEGLIGANYSDAPSTGPYVAYPTYFAEQLASKIIQTGGSDISTTSSYGELTVYSVLEPNGHIELMVLNKNPDAALTEQFNVSGFTPSGSAKLWQYGEAQDYAQSQTTDGSAALATSTSTLSLSGNNFSYTFPAYSMSVLDLTPKLTVATAATATPNPAVGTSVTLAVLGLENNGDSGLTYSWSATGPGTVTYTGNTNGTNAAKSINATVSQAGVYTFIVSVTDPSGQVVTSSIQATLLPVFANQAGSVLTISLNNIAPISVATSGSTITVTESGYSLSFTGSTSTIVNGSATNNILNINGTLATPVTFTSGATTTLYLNAGTLTVARGSGSTITTDLFSSVNIAIGAELFVQSPGSQATRTLISTQSLNIAGSAGHWSALLDLNGNDLDVQNGNLAILYDQLKQGYNADAGGAWQGSGGIISSAAASDTTHLTTLAIIQNSMDGTTTGAALYGSGTQLGLFDGISPADTDVLVKSTYYGDTNLDGVVDGSDYTRIDNGYHNKLTGWFNGDFNYDGTIDGDDYTLIDNAFNTQGGTFSPVMLSNLMVSSYGPGNQILLAHPTSKSDLITSNKAARSVVNPASSRGFVFSENNPITTMDSFWDYRRDREFTDLDISQLADA